LIASVRALPKLAPAREAQNTSYLELLVVAVFLGAMLAANFATAELYPRAWLDESMWVDPAINLLRHNGFTSSTWYSLTFGQFWYGNVPLYTGLIFAWAELVGDSFTALRSLNLILISLAALLLYWFARRTSEFLSARSRLGLLLILMLGNGVTFAYRSARPEALCLVLFALLLLASTLNPPLLRRGAIMAVSAILPWAGLQLVAYAVIASGLIVLHTGRRHLQTLLWMAAGLATGLCLMLAGYWATGHLEEFVISTVGSQQALVGQVGQYIVLGDDRGPARFTPSAIIGILVQDPSSMFGLVAAAILLTGARVRHATPAGYRLRAGITAGVLIPLGMFLAGKYPVYYTWMAVLPIWFLVLAALDRLDVSARRERMIACTLLALSLLAGWPSLIGSALLEANARDYSQVQHFVNQNIRPGQWACISPGAYFAVIERGGVPFLCTQYATSRLAPAIPQGQQQRLSVIIAAPRDAAKIMARLPGHWVEVASLRPPQDRMSDIWWLDNETGTHSYELDAYRRAK